MFKKIIKKIEMKLLTSLIDRFKARNPAIFLKAISIIEAVKIAAIAIIGLHLNLEEAFPILESVAFLKAIPIHMASVILISTEALSILTGSSTKGVGQLCLVLQDFSWIDKDYKKNEAAYFDKQTAEELISQGLLTPINI